MMIPKISLGMIKVCLAYVTTMWFSEHDFPADSFDEYDDYIDDMVRYARKHEDLLYLKLSLEYVLASPHVTDRLLEELSGECWDYDRDELMDVFRYIYSVVWCNRENPVFTQFPKIEFIKMNNTSKGLDEWKENKLMFNSGFDESKIEYEQL